MRLCALLLAVACVVALPTPESSEAPSRLDLADLLATSVVVTVDQSKCLNMCSGRGHCVINNSPAAPPQNTTICICNQGWTGSDCSSVMLPPSMQRDGSMDCPNNCSSHGVCYRGSSVVRPRCYCDDIYTGADCSKLREQLIVCPNNCSGFGVCTEGYNKRLDGVMAKCLCDSNHVGDDCSVEISSPCPRGCSGNGRCTKNGCVCNPHFIGKDCSLMELSPPCPKGCSSRGRCLKGVCYCFAGYGGNDCSKVHHPECAMECNGHGRCVVSTPYFPGGCICDDGWLAPDCKIAKVEKTVVCEKNCSDHGTCRPDATCDCHLGWTGHFCEYPAKIPEGKLVGPQYSGEPIVHPYYMGGKVLAPAPEDRTKYVETDEHIKCPNSCSSHGVCLQILSTKNPLFRPDGTSIPSDMTKEKNPEPSMQYICRCDPGYVGEDCSFGPPASSGLFPMGRVDLAKAPSAPPVTAGQPARLFMEDNTSWDKLPSMEQLKLKEMGCPNNCSSRGRCIRNKNGFPVCSCYPGWEGNDCNQKQPTGLHCPMDCSGHGRCVTANQYFPVRCLCDPPYYGDYCEKQHAEKIVFEVHDGFCLNHCSGRGPCINGKCVCMEMGWGGPDCSVQAGGVCAENCHGNGICFWGTCDCLGGYTGALCNVAPSKPCPNKCGMRGKCVGGTCVCLSGFTGDDCSDVMVECPNHCSGHGECLPAKAAEMVPATCECEIGWTGLDCSNFPKNTNIPAAESQPTQSQQIAAQERAKLEEANRKPSAFNPIKPKH